MNDINLDVLELEARRAGDNALEALELVNKMLDDAGFTTDFYAVKSRIKPLDAVINKVTRKVPDKPDYRPSSVTDIVGVRVVVLFQEQVVDAVIRLLGLLSHRAIYKSCLKKNEIKELIFFNVENSAAPVNLKNRINFFASMSGIDCEFQNSVKGYSSVHFLPFVELGDGSTFVVEIQIRTIFEDAWAEIDHKMRYQIERLGKSIEEFDDSHLNVLKMYCDSCSQYVSVIRKDEIKIHSFGLLRAETLNDFRKRCSDLPEDHDVFKVYKERYAQKENDEIALEKFAMKFSELYEHMDTQEAKYSIKMEEAFCYLSMDSQVGAEKALEIYFALHTEYKETYPLLYYRMSRASLKLDKIEEAERQNASTISMLEDNGPSILGNTYLMRNVYAQKSLIKWLQADQLSRTDLLGNKDTILSLLNEALEAVDEAYKYVDTVPKQPNKQKTQLNNNKLYFLVEIQKVEGKVTYTSKIKDLFQHMVRNFNDLNKDEIDTIFYVILHYSENSQFKKYRELSDFMKDRYDQTLGLNNQDFDFSVEICKKVLTG